MTPEQQDILIAKALGQPHLLTDQEADAIMADPELRQLLSTAATLKRAAQPAPECDVEAEWLAFRRRAITPRRRRTAIWRAAAIIAVAIGCAAAFLGLRHGSTPDSIALIDTIFPLRDTLVLTVKAEPAPIAMAPTITPKAKPRVAKPNPEPDSLVIQARIDNEIALMRAEAYRQIAAATQIDLPDDFPVVMPDFQIDGNELSMLTAQ